MGEQSQSEQVGILPHLVTEQQLADRLGLARDTLYRYRLQRIGPPFSKIGGAVWYRLQDVDEWLVSRQCRPVR